MNQNYKAKITHILENGDRIELESWVNAMSYDDAAAQAHARFKEAVAQLATEDVISIDKSKIESGDRKH